MTSEHYIIAKLAELMWSYDNEQEAIAVGCALRNRVGENLGWWDLIRDKNNRGDQYINIDPRDPQFLIFLWKAEEIFYGRLADVTDGSNAWARYIYLPHDTVTHHIGGLNFYRRNSGNTR